MSAGEAGEARITVRGELDSASAEQLAGAYAEALELTQGKSGAASEAGQPRPITLDLEHVDFIDSAGLRMLIVLQRKAEGQGIALTVLAAPESVTELLQLSGVGDRMTFRPASEPRGREEDFLERVELELEADDQAPSRARAAVRESLGPVLSDAALANVVLMTSELVTNGVIHSSGGRTVGLRLSRFADGVRVEVDDPGAGFDPSATPAGDAVPAPGEGGRGLFVVDRCATRWGIRRAETDRGRRFSVWFELDSEAI